MAAVLAAVAAGALACTDETAGQPTGGATTPQQTATTSSGIPFPTDSMTTEPTQPSGGSGPLTGKDPCEVAAPVRDELKAGDGTSSELAGTPHCRFSGSTFALDVALYTDKGLGDYQGSSKKITVGSHQGLEAHGSVGVCTVAIGVSDTSRIDVSATMSDGSDSCGLAHEAADALEPSLPK